jgi:condensin complex subunit 1
VYYLEANNTDILEQPTTAIMDARVEFDINESLKLYLSDPATIPTSEADSQLVDCENDPDSLTLPLISEALDPIVDAIAANPDALMQSANFDTLQFLLKCVPLSSPSEGHGTKASEAELFLFLEHPRSYLLKR